MAFVSFLLIVTISPFDCVFYLHSQYEIKKHLPKHTTSPAYSEEHAGIDGESRTPISLTPMHGHSPARKINLPILSWRLNRYLKEIIDYEKN